MNRIIKSKLSHIFSKLSVRIMCIVAIFIVAPMALLVFYVRDYLSNIIESELSTNVVNNISNNESFISESLEQLAFYSNRVVYNKELRSRLADPSSSEYYNDKYISQIIETANIDNSDPIIANAKIIIFDKFGRTYSNWSLNYQNYNFLLNEDWVKETKRNNGHITWSLFQPSYVKEEQNTDKRYISLARAILSDATVGDQIGTIIVSIDLQEFSRVLTKYSYEGDDVYICIDAGKTLMKLDSKQEIGDEEIGNIFYSTTDKRSGSIKKDIGNQTFLISYYTLPHPWTFNGQEMKVFHFTHYSSIEERINAVNKKIDIVIMIVLIAIVFAAVIAAKIIVYPIQKLTHEMGTFQVGAEIHGVNLKRNDEIGHLNRAFINLTDRIKELFDQLKHENEIKEQYHYESLQAQLNPHFLFNSLNTIRWMAIIRGADNIVKAIDALASLLKYSISRDTGLVRVEDELVNVTDYIYIHNLRYQDSVEIKDNISQEIRKLKTLKFIMQPIVENAILHGREEGTSGLIEITVSGKIVGDRLILQIEDNGIGIPQDAIDHFENHRSEKVKGSKMTGIGLTNVDELIRIRFGVDYGIRIARADRHGTIVTYTLPLIIEDGQNETDHGY